MRYMGGKSRIAKSIAETILTEVRKRGGVSQNILVSLFCGNCAVEAKLADFEHLILNDNHKYLIALLQGVQSGYVLPDSVTKEEYQYIRKHKDNDPVLAGFVGFGCSFGGKFFGGYASDAQNTNYADISKRSLLKDMSKLRKATFVNKDYRNVELPEGCVIYADPPYKGTTGYGNEKFDSEAFWEYARRVSQSHLMFISEQNAPDDFVSIWEKPFTRTLDRNKTNYFQATEKLFIHKHNLLNKF